VNKRPSIKAYLERAILKQSVVGFLAMILISVAVTFFLSRYKMSVDLQKSALAAAEAFRSRILEGDIKAVENQIHDVLGLGSHEEAFVLNPDLQRIYQSPHRDGLSFSPCEPIGETCFVSYVGSGRIFLPIFFDESRRSLFGYLYISKSLQFDWIYMGLVFSIFAIGYIALLLGLANVTKGSLGKLAGDLEIWAARLKENPKDRNPLSEAPFAELSPLKDAIEGLNSQIEQFENKAGHRAKTLLLRGIAHDILSPVAQVQFYLATLEKKLASDSTTEDVLNEIKASLRKVAMIAAQVKSLNESAEPVPPINLSDVVQDELDFLQKSDEVRSKEIKLNFSQHREGFVLVPMTRAEVGRILQNLVQNAVDASAPCSSIEVSISNEKGWSTLSVSDGGEGIPKHLHSKIFEPDFTSKPATGTGLGLFVVKHICEQREGFVELASESNRGTKISINIPSYQGGIHAV
jgi:signal transduction histidine kinase